MSNGNHFYNESIKFYNAVFMELFNDIYIKRQSKYIKVPIEFSDKRQEEVLRNENLDNVYGQNITLPRLGYRMTSIEYASYRNKNKLHTITGTNGQIYNRKPYDLMFDLYVKTKTLDDLYEILEQIFVQFDPYVELDVVDHRGTGIESNIAVEMLGNSNDTQNVGIYSDEQIVEAQLQFKLKGYLYGQKTDGKVIKKIILNYYNDYTNQKIVTDVVTADE